MEGTAATTITRKDGTVVTGTLSGMIVVKTEEEKSGGEYNSSYLIVNGSEVRAIDSQGVHRGPIFMSVTASQKEPFTDAEAVAAAVERIKAGGWSLMAADLPKGGSVFIVGATSGGPHVTKGRVIGQYREAGGKGALHPTLEVTTASGRVLIKIAEIVAVQ